MLSLRSLNYLQSLESPQDVSSNPTRNTADYSGRFCDIQMTFLGKELGQTMDKYPTQPPPLQNIPDLQYEF